MIKATSRTMFRVALVLLFVIATRYVFSQNSTSERQASVLSLGFDLGLAHAAADLSDKFGQLTSFGVKTHFISSKNWLYGLDASFMFGTDTKEDVFSHLRISDGRIIGNDRSTANVYTRARILQIGANIGYIIKLKPALNKTGIFVGATAGFISHKYKVTDDFQSVPQLLEENIPGFDRLTAGWYISQQIGWISNELIKNRLKYYIIAEVSEAFTESLRQYNYSQFKSDYGESRFDMIYSLRAGVLIQLGNYGDASYIYY